MFHRSNLIKDAYSLAECLSSMYIPCMCFDDVDADYDMDVMNAVNPNLAMTNSLPDTEHDDIVTTACSDEPNQTDDVKPEIYMWDESDVYESEPVVSSDVDQSVQTSAADDLSEVNTSSLVVTCTTKLVRRQPTIIVTHARHPTTSYGSSPVIARLSNSGILSKIKPNTLTIDGSSGLMVKNNTVLVSSPEDGFCKYIMAFVA